MRLEDQKGRQQRVVTMKMTEDMMMTKITRSIETQSASNDETSYWLTGRHHDSNFKSQLSRNGLE